MYFTLHCFSRPRRKWAPVRADLETVAPSCIWAAVYSLRSWDGYRDGFIRTVQDQWSGKAFVMVYGAKRLAWMWPKTVTLPWPLDIENWTCWATKYHHNNLPSFKDHSTRMRPPKRSYECAETSVVWKYTCLCFGSYITGKVISAYDKYPGSLVYVW